MQVLAVDRYDRAYSIGLDELVSNKDQGLDLATMMFEQRESEQLDLDSGLERFGITGDLVRWKDVDTVSDRYSIVQQDAETTELDDIDLALRSDLNERTTLRFDYGPSPLNNGNFAMRGADGLFLGHAELFDSTNALAGRGMSFGGEHQLSASLSVGAQVFQPEDDPSTVNASQGLGYQGIYLAHRRQSSTTGLSLGLFNEQDSMMGSTSDGLFATDMSASQVMTLSHRHNLGAGFNLAAQATVSSSDVEGSSSMAGWSRVTSHGFAMSLTKNGITSDKDRLGLMIGQPMRSEGSVSLDLPRYSDENGQIINQKSRVELEPTGRQIDFQLAYSRELDKETLWSAYALARRHPGHNAEAGIDTGVGVRLLRQF